MTQRDQILAHLQAGHTITPLQALSLFGCMALSQRMTELRKMGYPIVSTLVREGRKSYARYAMAPETTKAPAFAEALAL